MSLLRAFDLEVIDKVFSEDAKIKLCHHSKMLYINCLTHQFKTKEMLLENIQPFNMLKNNIPNYDQKFKTLFTNLECAKLLRISVDSIEFFNVWSKHIDISVFDLSRRSKHMSYEVEDYQDEMYNSHQLYEVCARKYKIQKQQMNKLLQLFFEEQKLFKKKYQSDSDIIKHFYFWCESNIDKVKYNNTNSQSSNRIIGM